MDKPSHGDHTDLCTILSNIKILLSQTGSSVNAVSGQLLAMAIAVECVTLSQKLLLTLQRWQVYLPFHEYRDVKFGRWVSQLTAIRKTMDSYPGSVANAPDDEYYPDPSFCLDLLEMFGIDTESLEGFVDNGGTPSDGLYIFTPRYGESELQRDVMEYVSRLDDRKKCLIQLSEEEEQEWLTGVNKRAMGILHKQYTNYLYTVFYDAHLVETEVLPKVRDYLNAVIEQPIMGYCLDMALDMLIDTLRQMNKLFSDDKSSQQFLRLSLRLYYRHCPDALSEAISMVRYWSSEWSHRHRKQRAIEKREELIASLQKRYGALRIADYIEIDRPSPLTDSEFGHFLFASRHKLETDQVKSLFQDCFLIQQLNILIDPTGIEEDISASSLSPHRKQVYQRLGELVRQAEWKAGMTPERVQRCLTHLLLRPTPPAVDGQTDIGEVFWRLLTNRRNCGEEFRSLKLTWLNLAGYFRSRGFLSGGSLMICRHFFPDNTPEGRNNRADHNAVNKGARDDAGNDFRHLIQALDRQL